MQQSPTSSFIPKQSKKSDKPKRTRRRVVFPILSIVGYALFVSSLVAALGIFIYEQYALKQLDQAVLDLDREIGSFNKADLFAIANDAQRIKYAEELLRNKIFLTDVINELEGIFLQTVSLSGISIERDDEKNLAFTANVSAADFDALILQRNTLGSLDSDYILNNDFTDISYQPESAESTKEISFGIELVLAGEPFTLATLTGTESQNQALPLNEDVVPGLVGDEDEAGVDEEDNDSNQSEAGVENINI